MKMCFFHIKNLELRQKLFRKSTKLLSEIYLRNMSIVFCQDFIFKVKNMQVFKPFFWKINRTQFSTQNFLRAQTFDTKHNRKFSTQFSIGSTAFCARDTHLATVYHMFSKISIVICERLTGKLSFQL